MSCSELPPFVLLLPVASSVGNKECPAEFQSSAGRFAIKCFGSDIVSGNQFPILFCISSTDGNCLLRSSGRQLVSFLNIPIAHGAVRKLIQEDHSVSPRNLCRHRLHKCFIRISFREFCHVFEVAHGIAFDIRERNTDIGGKILYEFTPQCLAFVYHLAYMVIAS